MIRAWMAARRVRLPAGGASRAPLSGWDLHGLWHKDVGPVMDPAQAWVDAKTALLQASDGEKGPSGPDAARAEKPVLSGPEAPPTGRPERDRPKPPTGAGKVSRSE